MFMWLKIFIHNPSHPNPRRTKKIKLNFYFYTSLRCLRRFYEYLKGLHKTFWGTTKKCEKKKINWIFISIQLSEMHGSLRINQLLFLFKSSKNLWFSDDFSGWWRNVNMPFLTFLHTARFIEKWKIYIFSNKLATEKELFQTFIKSYVVSLTLIASWSLYFSAINLSSSTGTEITSFTSKLKKNKQQILRKSYYLNINVL